MMSVVPDVPVRRRRTVNGTQSPQHLRGLLGDVNVVVTHGGRELCYPQLYEPGWLAAQLRARRSLADIAAEVGCATATVRRAIRSQNMTDRRRLHEVRFVPLHDPAWLRRRYIDDGRNATELAAEIGCRPPSVIKALHRYGLDVRPGRPRRRYPQLHDPAWLRHRHHHDRRPVGAIAAEIGCSTTSVRRALRRYAIAVRGKRRNRIDRLHDPAWLRSRYLTDRASLEDLAAELDCRVSSVRRALANAGIALRPHLRTAPTTTRRDMAT
jgi:hypothetical protein